MIKLQNVLRWEEAFLKSPVKFSAVHCLKRTFCSFQYQTKKTEQQIKNEFERLHQFLYEEQASRLAALRQEEVQKSLMNKQKIEEINILISYFAYILNMIQEEMGSENISFMEVGNGCT